MSALPPLDQPSQQLARLARRRFDAIVIGASAGGVEVLLRLLPALRAGLQAAVFIVVHLPREHESLLPAIFAPRCALPVSEARDKVTPKPGHVYVAPPDYHLLVDTGPVLALSVDEPVYFSRPSIDVLFEAAADAYGPRALGIVLSGGSPDGAAGLACIALQGGGAVVQSPQTAAVDTMPLAAIEHCPQALVLSPPQLADFLHSLS